MMVSISRHIRDDIRLYFDYVWPSHRHLLFSSPKCISLTHEQMYVPYEMQRFHVNAHCSCECGYCVRILCEDEKSSETHALSFSLNIRDISLLCVLCNASSCVTSDRSRISIFVRDGIWFNVNLFKRFSAISSGNTSVVSFRKLKNSI